MYNVLLGLYCFKLKLNFEYRTRCEEEPEEETIIREIQSMFPNDAADDFGEFVQEATLEQIKTNKPTTMGSKTESAFLSAEDFKIICKTFILLMNKFSRYILKLYFQFLK